MPARNVKRRHFAHPLSAGFTIMSHTISSACAASFSSSYPRSALRIASLHSSARAPERAMTSEKYRSAQHLRSRPTVPSTSAPQPMRPDSTYLLVSASSAASRHAPESPATTLTEALQVQRFTVSSSSRCRRAASRPQVQRALVVLSTNLPNPHMIQYPKGRPMRPNAEDESDCETCGRDPPSHGMTRISCGRPSDAQPPQKHTIGKIPTPLPTQQARLCPAALLPNEGRSLPRNVPERLSDQLRRERWYA